VLCYYLSLSSSASVLACCSSASCAHPDLHSFPTRRSSDLGLDCLELNRLPEAIESLQRALAINASAGTARLALGDALARSGRCRDRKSTRLNSSHGSISYAVFCLKKKKQRTTDTGQTLRTS